VAPSLSRPRGPGPRLIGLGLVLALLAALPSPALALGSPQVCPASRVLPAQRPGLGATLQRVIDSARAEFGMPGVSVAIRFPGGASWTGVSGLADVAGSIPVRPETPFALASLTKPFVAGVVMGLVQDGRLRLGDSVARLLPGVKLGGQAIDARITVRQLLDHSSGLRDHLTSGHLDKEVLAAPSVRWSIQRALRYVGKPVAAPGVRFYYANTNYVLLGMIVERLIGTPIAQQLKDRWIRPLGLTTATYQGVDKPSSRPAIAYRFASDKPNATPIDVTDGSDFRPFTAITTASGAAGSLMASASDTARWLEALLRGDSLTPVTVARMVGDAGRAVGVDRRAPYGLGLQVYSVDGRLSYGHSGRLLGDRAVGRYFPSAGLTIVVLTNQSRTDPGIVLRRLLDVLLPVARGPNGEPIPVQSSGGAPRNRMCVGEYHFPARTGTAGSSRARG
jgi:D-alanyl-D-alanine carboxypeptidase